MFKLLYYYYPLLILTAFKDQLDWLELSDNGNVTDTGVGYLKNLSKLKYLKLEKLPGVRNPKDLFDKLKSALPSCEII